MNPPTIFGIVIAIVAICSIVALYNHLVQLKNNVTKAWANIDVLLKQRYDEIPNVIAAVKGYAKHEKDLMEQIATIRASYVNAHTVTDKAQTSALIHQAFGQFLGIVENYPKLRANENFMALQKRITELEESIADRREFYNDSVTIFNTRIEQFPYNVFAKLFGYTSKELFVVEAGERAQRDVNIAN